MLKNKCTLNDQNIKYSLLFSNLVWYSVWTTSCSWPMGLVCVILCLSMACKNLWSFSRCSTIFERRNKGERTPKFLNGGTNWDVSHERRKRTRKQKFKQNLRKKKKEKDRDNWQERNLKYEIFICIYKIMERVYCELEFKFALFIPRYNSTSHRWISYFWAWVSIRNI